MTAAFIAAAGAVASMLQLPTHSTQKKELRSFARSLGLEARKRGPGWTQAQVQRLALKRRNQARHRAHCKRKGSR
ncbi:MAG: hypothetical protein QM702_04410 [Rubrivivax sp.]